MMKRLLFSLIIALSFSGYSEKIITIDNDSITSFSISDFVYILEDTTTKLELKKVILTDNKKYFKLNNSSNLNLGFTKSAYWIKFTVENKTKLLKNLIFSIDYPLLRSIYFYEVKGTRLVRRIITGEKEKFNSRDIKHRSFLFDLELEPNVTYTYFARISSEGGTLRMPMTISSYKYYIAKDKFGIVLNGVFMGLVILSILFNLFLLSVSKEVLNLYYTIFVASIALFLINISGFSYQYLWPNSTWFQYHSTVFFALIANVFLLLFTREYFNFKEHYKKIELIFKIVFPFSLIIAILTLTVQDSFYLINRIANIISFFTIFLLLFVSILGIFRKDKLAIYLFISFSAFITGVILYVLRNFGIHGNNGLAENGIKVGFILEIIFLMFAVIHRYTYMGKRENTRLENLVSKRTSDLVTQKEEIETQRDKILRQHEEVTKQKNLILEKNEEINKSFDYAKIIQTAVLPPENELQKFLQKFFILNLPKEIISGDFYWVEEKNDRTYIAASDCTGHGVPGAMMSMLGISALNDIIGRNDTMKPSEILQELSRNIENSLHQQGKIGESKDGMDISLCMIDKLTNTLLYSGSNNSIYIVRNNKFDEEDTTVQKIYNYDNCNLLELKPDKIFIGYNVKKDLVFTDKRFDLQKGDTIYMFSDGYADQFGGLNKKKYKYKKFRELIAKVSSITDMEKQKEFLHYELNQWKGDVEQIDDILIIGINHV